MIMRMTINLLLSNGGSDHGMSISSALSVTVERRGVDMGGCRQLSFGPKVHTFNTHL